MQLTYGLKGATALGLGALIAVGAPAYALAPAGTAAPVTNVLAEGLDNPFGLALVSDSRAVVAQNASGEVTSINLRTGAKRPLISGLPSPSGVAVARGKVYVVLGGPNETGAPVTSEWPQASVLEANADGTGVRVLADLMSHELAHNPDGQVQLVDGHPVDALSNPFSITSTPWGLLVADGGANAVLRVDPRTGRVSTYFVPPTVKTPACLAAGAQANPGTVGCDPVPTGVAQQGNSVYVSTLGAESPGAARIYKLDGRTGRVQRVWQGFTSLTGVAVSPGGTIYASEVLFGAPAGDGPPPAGFDPASIGRITRIANGRVSHAGVTMPTGLVYRNGRLFASSWSTASFFGLEHAGKIAQVNSRAFS